MHGSGIPIWFFIGVLLVIYGAMIFGYGVFEWHDRQLSARGAVDQSAHAGLVGRIADLLWALFYTIKFRPGRAAQVDYRMEQRGRALAKASQ